jgi:hypothetical protein
LFQNLLDIISFKFELCIKTMKQVVDDQNKVGSWPSFPIPFSKPPRGSQNIMVPAIKAYRIHLQKVRTLNKAFFCPAERYLALMRKKREKAS